jgi:hypothetical protein
MQIDRIDVQLSNADSPSTETLEPDSNVKLTSASQFAKQRRPIVSTDDGMQMD